MSASQGCIDDKAVVESFKEALIGRVGADRFRMWFTHGVRFVAEAEPEPHHDRGVDDVSSLPSPVVSDASGNAGWKLSVRVRGQFALDRLRNNFLQEIRGAAMQACGSRIDVQLCLDEVVPQQVDLPLDSTDGRSASEPTERDQSAASDTENRSPISSRRGSRGSRSSSTRQRRSRGTSSLRQLVSQSTERVSPQGKPSNSAAAGSSHRQPELPSLSETSSVASKPNPGDASREAKSVPRNVFSLGNLIVGSSNRLAYTAVTMACQEPSTASPLFLCGPTGTGKTHMMSAIAEQLRRRHRMRRVMHLSAEQFTNDFISSVGNSGITAFRRRYREVDALLIDDVQFLGAKKATLREMLYTVETLASEGRALVFSGLRSPTEIDGLSQELAGRMAAGLVCSIQPLDKETRETLLRRLLKERCPLEVTDTMIQRINATIRGDGRVISGVVNVINTLQRMYGRLPTMDELQQFAGDLLRSASPAATLSVIESAVCQAFQLTPDTLRGGSQTRAVTEPRMLAMYLSRQLTSSAYSEIARHFGGKSHSTAISAEKNVQAWLEKGKAIGRGQAAVPTREAIERIEGMLRTG